MLPYYEKYMNADWEERIEMIHYQPYATPYYTISPERKWKEGVLSVGYDWKGRYEVDFSYFRIWEEKLFSSDGWRVPAVMLGWTLSEEPILRRVLPESLKRWSVNASWSETNDYAPLLDDAFGTGLTDFLRNHAVVYPFDSQTHPKRRSRA